MSSGPEETEEEMLKRKLAAAEALGTLVARWPLEHVRVSVDFRFLFLFCSSWTRVM